MPTSPDPATPNQALVVGLWAAQALIFAAFTTIASIKLFTPMPRLAGIVPWADEFPEAFVRGIGFIDLAGGLGILVPAATRLLPRLSVLAALSCATLQVFAIVFHFSRGEGAATPTNFVLLALAIFVFWGRSTKVPIRPR